MASEKSLEQRLQHVEDMIAIYQAISAYGPSVDSDCFGEAAELWAAHGTYEIPGIAKCEGREEIIGLFEGDQHQTLIRNGAAHVLSMPHVTIEKDRAVATNYGRVYVPREDGFGLYRVIATRWEFVRTDKGWKIERRINHLLDGRAEARDLLGQGIKESHAAIEK